MFQKVGFIILFLLGITGMIIFIWTENFSTVFPAFAKISAIPIDRKDYRAQTKISGHQTSTETPPSQSPPIQPGSSNHKMPAESDSTGHSMIVTSSTHKISVKSLEHKIPIKVPGRRIKKKGERIEIVEWVCIPPPTIKMHILKAEQSRCNHTLHRSLEAYHATSNKTEKIYNTEVQFRPEPIPEDYTILWNHTAIFYGYNIGYHFKNFLHYVTEYFFPFYRLLDIWHKSNLTEHAHIFYFKPLGDECTSTSRRKYSSFFLGSVAEMRATEQYSYNYNFHPGKTCYRYGLFAREKENRLAKEAIKHVRDYYGINKTCPKNSVTLLQRKHTRIWLNVEEAKQALISAGYVNTTVADFDKVPLRGQLQLMYCTDVYVSVHGSALQWAYFMKPNSTTVEIAFPEFGWNFLHFFPTNNTIPMRFIRLETKNVTKYQESIDERVRTGRITAEDAERVRRLKGKERVKEITRMTLGGDCNFYVDPSDVLKIIKKLIPLS